MKVMNYTQTIAYETVCLTAETLLDMAHLKLENVPNWQYYHESEDDFTEGLLRVSKFTTDEELAIAITRALAAMGM